MRRLVCLAVASWGLSCTSDRPPQPPQEAIAIPQSAIEECLRREWSRWTGYTYDQVAAALRDMLARPQNQPPVYLDERDFRLALIAMCGRGEIALEHPGLGPLAAPQIEGLGEEIRACKLTRPSPSVTHTPAKATVHITYSEDWPRGTNRNAPEGAGYNAFCARLGSVEGVEIASGTEGASTPCDFYVVVKLTAEATGDPGAPVQSCEARVDTLQIRHAFPDILQAPPLPEPAQAREVTLDSSCRQAFSTLAARAADATAVPLARALQESFVCIQIDGLADAGQAGQIRDSLARQQGVRGTRMLSSGAASVSLRVDIERSKRDDLDAMVQSALPGTHVEITNSLRTAVYGRVQR